MDGIDSRTVDAALDAARPVLMTLTREEMGVVENSRLRLEEADDGISVQLSDRAVGFEPGIGPEAEIRWTLVLTAGGDVVGKFGPFVSIEAATERAATLLTSRTTYTVCCDG